MKPLRFFGHPVHAILVPFPLASWCLAVLWDLVGFMTGDLFWLRTGWWTLVVGLLVAVPTAMAGLVDLWSLDDDHPAADGAVLHMVVAVVATAGFGVIAWLHARILGGRGPGLVVLMAADLVAVALLAWGGWLGGELVFRYGVGVDGEEEEE